MASVELEQAACDAEVLDARRGPAAVRRAMPPKVARFIDARDKGRCRVPGCTNRAFVERHHEGGWRVVGHDPRRAFVVCSAHHRAIHEGALVVSFGRDDLPRFALADGSPVGSSCDGASHETWPTGASRETGMPGASLGTGATGASHEALAALRKLGFANVEAQSFVRAALVELGGGASVADLVRRALARVDARVS